MYNNSNFENVICYNVVNLIDTFTARDAALNLRQLENRRPLSKLFSRQSATMRENADNNEMVLLSIKLINKLYFCILEFISTRFLKKSRFQIKDLYKFLKL